ncbi:MAG: threonine ammonia-lyase [Proteobacteria bacterium]|nr:threonine ammonia-lyase [Pseudomonadota bacterium]
MAPEDILKSIEKSYNDIKSFIHHTPLIYSNSFSKMFSKNIYLKAENIQKTGSFKVRGALNKILKTNAKMVSAVSMGNHAQGVAYAGRSLGIKVKIVMPLNASIAKVEATKSYGAKVILRGDTLSESLLYAKNLTGYTFIHPFNDFDVICGQGTLGIEILKDLPEITDVIIPVGGGGLISGISAYLKEKKPSVKIIGVQTESAKSGVESFKKGILTPMSPLPTIADGISVEKIGEIPFEIIKKYVDDIVSVKEESIAKAILLLMERKKLVVEGAGAVGLAYLLEDNGIKIGRNTLLILSGGNIDMMLMDKIIFTGLISSKRILSFSVEINNFSKEIYEIIKIIEKNGGVIKNLLQDNLNMTPPFQSNIINFLVETKGEEQAKKILYSLENKKINFFVKES